MSLSVNEGWYIKVLKSKIDFIECRAFRRSQRTKESRPKPSVFPRHPNRLTFKSGSVFFEYKRKRPSLKVKRLVCPCSRCSAFWPGPRTQPGRVLAFPLLVVNASPLPSSRPPSRDLLSGRGRVLYKPIFQYYTRQQTTTNDYFRQQTFVQRLSLDKVFIFAALIKN